MVFQMMFQNTVLDGHHGGRSFVLPRVMNVEHVDLLVSAVFRFKNCHEFLWDDISMEGHHTLSVLGGLQRAELVFFIVYKVLPVFDFITFTIEY